MHYGKPSCDCFLINLFLPYILEVEIAGHNDPFGTNGTELTELVLSLKLFVLSYLLEYTKHEFLVLLDIVYENCFFVRIAVPVL